MRDYSGEILSQSVLQGTLVDDRYQFSSVQSLDQLGRRGNMRDYSAEILVQSVLQGALVDDRYQFSSVQFSPLKGHEGLSSRDPLPVCSTGGYCG